MGHDEVRPLPGDARAEGLEHVGALTHLRGWRRHDRDQPETGKVELRIPVDSLDTNNKQRDDHLKSNDFLAMDEFPTITFRSTGVTTDGEGDVDITGDLTIKGTTKSVTVPFDFEGVATDPFGNLRAGFEGSVTINRKDYGINWNAALEAGGVLVSDKVTLEFEVSAIKSA